MTDADWGPERFGAAFDVSRETVERLTQYADLLRKWNRTINLVARPTEGDIWGRHFADSAQLWSLRPPAARRWADLGSGAGFPGMVIAAIAQRKAPTLTIALVESDGRKVAFLGEVARTCGIPVEIHARRAEAVPPLAADVLSARALAVLPDLLSHAEKHLSPTGICLFLKGRTVHKEVEEARRSWQFQSRTHQSLTDPTAGILQIGAIRRV